MLRTRLTPLFLASALLAASPVFAGSDLVAPRVEPATLSLSAQVRESVAPDLMRVHFAVERSGKDLGAANRQVLQLANEALASVKASAPSLEATIQQVMTIPVYNDQGRPQGWRVRAELAVQGPEFDKVSVVAGKLSTKLEMVSLDFALSAAARKDVQVRLRSQLGSEFLTKATATARALGYRTAEVRTVHLQEDEGELRVPPMQRGMAMAAVADAMPEMPSQAGKTEVVVRMNGSVELVR